MENVENSRHLYLDLMKRCLVNMIYPQSEKVPSLAAEPGLRSKLARRLLKLPRSPKVWPSLRDAQGKLPPLSTENRVEGRIWPIVAHTMIGLKRLANLQFCIEEVITNGVPGDLIETGVWRGGATIFMRAVLKAYGVSDRCVWVADSFRGLPPPDEAKYPHDTGDTLYEAKELAVSLEEVKANFERYGLLDDQVRFLKGWFRDTLAAAPIERLAVLRLDGDMYESTMDALVNLYPKLSDKGYIIVDDYGCIPACRQAVQDYRSANGIVEKIREIDWTGIFWQKGESAVNMIGE
jgi:O-methyltransferase